MDPEDRQGDRHPDSGAQARAAEGQSRDRVRSRSEGRLARADVPGRHRARSIAKTNEVTMYPFPKEWQSNSTQASMVSPQHSDVDGKVWTNNQEYHDMYRLDVATGKFENVGPSKDPDGKQISAYGMPTDQQNNVYQLEFGGTRIGLRDAKTGTTMIYPDADRRIRGRAAAASTSRTGCGSPNIRATPSACSIRRRRRSRNTRCRRSGATPTTWCRARTPRKSGPARCRTTSSRGSRPRPAQITEYLLPRSDQYPPRLRAGRRRPAPGALGRQQPRRARS